MNEDEKSKKCMEFIKGFITGVDADHLEDVNLNKKLEYAYLKSAFVYIIGYLLKNNRIDEARKQIEKINKVYLKTNKILALHTSLFALITFSAVIITLIIGGNEIIMGIGVASTVMLLVDYISDINDHMQSLLNHAHGILSKYNAFLRILKISSIAKEEDNGIKNIDKIKSIEFKNVKMSYDNENIILEDINLKIDKP